MCRSVRRRLSARNETACPLTSCLAALVALASCATETAVTKPETAPSHVYARPLDDVLDQTKALLVQKGWRVQRAGSELSTNWVGTQKPTPPSETLPLAPITGTQKPADLTGYHVYGERIDAEYCSIRIVRVVATTSDLYFGQKKGGNPVAYAPGSSDGLPQAVHHGSSYAFENADVAQIEGFQQEAPGESAIRSDAPFGMVVNEYVRDEAMERWLDEQLAAPVVVATAPREPPAASRPLATPALAEASATRQPGAKSAEPAGSAPRPTAFAGIWNGTFTFRGTVTGYFAAEVPIAADGDFVDVDDFCPENGGTLAMQASGGSASWQGKLVCSPIRLKSCPGATLSYDFATAALKEDTLTVHATGTVATDARCSDLTGTSIADHLGGPFEAAFVGQKGDYVHIAVTRTKRVTACIWPQDWEDFASRGSMPMPEPPMEDNAFLGIIRTKGSRLTDVQRLLRHCHYVVLFRGQPVSMRVAVTRHDMH